MEHIEYALRLDQDTDNGFSDIYLVHNSLPELNIEQVSTECEFLGKKLSAPLLINAMTGGHPDVVEINRSLARAARITGIAMAVGSQKAGLESPEVAFTYQVAREENPAGVVLANLSAGDSWMEARAAVEMIEADALQFYLNVPQEIAMREGERDFSGILKNIEQVNKTAGVPLIVKEVGFGMSMETVRQLAAAGISWIDIGGKGGTDFMAIEQMRGNLRNCREFQGWGLTTAVSLLEGLSLNLSLNFIASGGIRTVPEIVKALVLGARLVGIARPFLRILYEESEKKLISYIEDIIRSMKIMMLMLGARRIDDLRLQPAVITGSTADWLEKRGIDLTHYAQRFNS
ncbi:type 2 isopentenyl-diphosphate Delta-isomerase [Desulfolucanica intricata]|uniref:type 2 isopentenyl-diphosphate Delta-isomerase n=1 Tax=Desulfolucanica intricata TaxID=1285191 RepID=UPI00350E374B